MFSGGSERVHWEQMNSCRDSEAAVRRCSVKKLFLKISQYSHENT